MISIEAYRAAIGRRNNRFKHIIKGHSPILNGYDIYFILIACFLLTFLPATLYLMFLMFICITVDLISFKFARYMRMNTESRNTLLNNLDIRYNNCLKVTNFYAPLVNRTKNKPTLIRYFCLLLLFTSCITFICNGVGTAFNS